MKIDQTEYERIEKEIHSDKSPVGIDAKKAHIYIIYLLESIESRVKDLESRLDDLEKNKE